MSEENKIRIYFGLFETLGDVIVSTALIRAIKKKYPNSEITYATSQAYVDCLAGNPDISRILPTRHQHEIVLMANAEKYDKVYLPLMLTQEDTLWHQRPEYCFDHEGREYRNLIDMYADKCQDDLKVEERRTYIYPEDLHWETFLKAVPDGKENTFTDQPFITVHTTSRNPSKDWPYEKFAELCSKIKEKYPDHNIIQIGGDNDKDLPLPVISVKGTPILVTAALIKRSKLHIDIDSGPSFIADSLDIPTICIMGASSSAESGPLNKENVTFLDPVRECLGTATHCPCVTKCLIDKPCINTIEADEVMAVVESKLKVPASV